MPPPDRNAAAETAERALLGGLLRDAAALSRLPPLEPGQFYRPAHGSLYALLRAMYRERVPVDLVTVGERIARTGAHQRYGGIGYVLGLTEACPSTANLAHYAQQVLSEDLRRRTLATLRELTEAAGVLTGRELAARCTFELAGLQLEACGHRPWSTGDMADVLDDMEQEQRHWQAGATPHAIGLGSAMMALNAALNDGFRPGDVVTIMGNPGMGKTALALCIAMGIIDAGRSVHIASLEMPTRQLKRRILAIDSVHLRLARHELAEVPLGHLMSPWRLSADQWDTLEAQREKWAAFGTRLTIDDTGGQTLADIEVAASRAQAQSPEDAPLGAIVVDYLQLMGDVTRARAGEAAHVIQGIMGGLKALAKRLGIACVVLVQLNRGNTKRENKRPTMSDGKGSSGIEDSTDIGLGVYREQVAERTDDTARMQIEDAEVIVLKYRNGRPGTVHMQFEGAHGAWYSV